MRIRPAGIAAFRAKFTRAGAVAPVGLHRGLPAALLLFFLALLTTTCAWAEERKVLRVVGDENYPPFLFRDPSGEATGYLVDWWALWSHKTGVAVDLRVERWSEAQAMLLRGDADVIDNLFRTPEREPLYSFTQPYASVPVNVYVHGSISGIKDLKGLRGFLVGVMAGDACIETLRKAGVTNLREFPDYAALVEHALRDDVRVFCLDEMPASYYLTRAGGHKTFRKAFKLYEGRFHRGVRKGDAETLRLVARGAAAITAAEEAALREKWLPQPAIDYEPWLRGLVVGFILAAVFAVALVFALRAARRRVRRQTAALEAEQARLASLFQALPDLVWLKDPDGTYVACNTALEHALGAPPGGVVGRHDVDFFDAAKAAEFLAQDRAAMAAEGPQRAEAWANFPGIGMPRLYQLTKQRVLDANGRLLGTVAITRDITEQSMLEEALQERVKELRCLYAVFKATEKVDRPLPEVLRAVVAELPAGFRYPEVAIVRVDVDGVCESSGRLEDAVATLHAEIPAEGGSQGRVSVGYAEARPLQSEVPFDDEERRLLEAVAERLGSFLQARAAATQLERARHFAQQIIDTANVLVLGLDREGRVLFLNPAGQALTGYTEAELVGEDWFALLLRFEEDDASRANFARTLATGDGVDSLENTLWTKEGVGRRILWSYSVVLDPEGERIAVAFGMDVTEQRRTEAALADYQQHLETLVAARTAELEATSASLRSLNEEQQAIFDASTAGIVLLRERVVVRCNRTMETMLGYAAGELVGCSSRVWFSDEAEFLEVGRTVEQAFAAGEAYREERELVRKDGSRFWGRLHAAPIDPDDPSKGVAGMIRDITLERAAVEEIKRARAVAEEAARAKSDFLANMSHEIRTPMNAIIGMAHLALRTELTPRQRDYLSKIQGASEHLLGIINDILDFSKSEAGKLELEQAEFALEPMLSNVTALLGGKIGAKELELVLDVAPDVPRMLVGDELRIRQVLLNFCSNAVKFTERGEVDIIVRLRERDANEALLEFAVRDTGIGLSEEQQGRLFQSFQQADSSTSRRYGGTGLGLVISKRLVDLMHGEIGVDSRPGAGSTFWFRVRLGIGRAQAPAPQPAPDLRGARMLVVDDNGTARSVLADMLARMGFVVDQAASGAAALECVRQAAGAGRDYAVVFLDWRMPGMDGVETARRIRELGLAAVPRCVMVTAHGREELLQLAAASGVTSVLLKPVSASLLFDTLVEVLAGRAPAPAVAAAPVSDGREALALLRGARILLVEDNELNQEVAKAMLEALGLVVDVAENGEVALARVQAASYDLVFMDMQMPVMDGLAATRAIRRLPGTGAVPIVAMTANVLQQDRERCFEAGMNDYLAKPIEPAKLTAALQRWIKPRSDAAGRPAAPAGGPAGLALEIDGLDVAGALRRVAGNAPFLLSLLRRFVDNNRHAVAEIDHLLASGDRPGAERRAHTLKGVAATLGATRVQQAAADLEAALRADPDSAATAERLATLGAVLVSLCVALDRQLPGVTLAEASTTA